MIRVKYVLHRKLTLCSYVKKTYVLMSRKKPYVCLKVWTYV